MCIKNNVSIIVVIIVVTIKTLIQFSFCTHCISKLWSRDDEIIIIIIIKFSSQTS